MNIEEIVRKNEGTVIDVRTVEEFRGGNIAGSINIPLHEIPQRLEELKNMKQPIVFCCASGGRSEQASNYISSLGLDCCNGGSWLDVNYYQSLNR